MSDETNKAAEKEDIDFMRELPAWMKDHNLNLLLDKPIRDIAEEVLRCMNGRIRGEWKAYRVSVLESASEPPGRVQVIETRKAFFAGFIAAIHFFTQELPELAEKMTHGEIHSCLDSLLMESSAFITLAKESDKIDGIVEILESVLPDIEKDTYATHPLHLLCDRCHDIGYIRSAMREPGIGAKRVCPECHGLSLLKWLCHKQEYDAIVKKTNPAAYKATGEAENHGNN